MMNARITFGARSTDLIRWAWAACWVSLWLLLPGAILPRANAQVSIVERGKRATALVDLGELGSGSAFCIDPAGLFVTNWHVVATREHGEKVTVVVNAGEPKQKAFEATVVGVDPEVDLALLQAERATNFAALGLGEDRTLRETVEITAFGYPFGKWLAVGEKPYPSVSVNKGRITALRKEEGALSLIQIDASVNPGNSGGPVLDARGRVIGVVVSTAMFGSGVNFVIPVSRLKAFLKRPHLALAWEPIGYADRYDPVQLDLRVISFPRVDTRGLTVELTLSVGLGDRRPVKLARVSPTAFRARVAPVPKPSGKRRLKLQVLGDRGAIDGWTDDRTIHVGDAKVALRDIRSIDCQPVPRVTQKSGPPLSGSVSALGTMTAEIDGEIQAVDLEKAALIEISELKVDEGQVQYTLVASRNGDEVNRVKGAIRFGESPSRAPFDRDALLRAMLRAIRHRAKKEAATETQTLRFPYGLSGVAAVGGGGKYLLLHLSQVRKLAILNVETRRVTGYVPLPARQVLVAAGLEKFVVGLPQKRALQRWNLATRQQEAETTLEGMQRMTALVMGSASSGPVMVSGNDGEKRIVDLDTLKPMQVFWPSNLKGWRRCRASADGKTFTGWGDDKHPYGMCWMRLLGDRVVGWRVERMFGSVVPSYDGSLFIARDRLLSRRFEKIPLRDERLGRPFFLPTDHPRLLAGLGISLDRRGLAPGLQLFSVDDQRPVCSGPVLWEMAEPGSGRRDEQLPDRRVVVLPGNKAVATVPLANDRVVIHRYDWAQKLKAKEDEYLFVASSPSTAVREGHRWTYQLDVRSSRPGVQYRLLSGPGGMSVSPDGLVTWNVPERLESDWVPMAVEVAGPAGRRLVHRAALLPRRETRTAETGAPPGGEGREGEIDLLSQVNAHHNALAGTWTWQDNGLRVASTTKRSIMELPIVPKGSYRLCAEFTVKDRAKEESRVLVVDPSPFARSEIPVRLQGSYEVTACFVRREGTGDVVLVLPVGAHRCALKLSVFGGKLGGIALIDGKWIAQNKTKVSPCRLQNGKEYRLEVRVYVEGEKARIAVDLDGRQLVRWAGDASALSVASEWAIRHPDCLALGTWKAKVVWREVRLRVLSGPAPLLRPESGGEQADSAPSGQSIAVDTWVDVLPLVEPAKDSVAGRWSRQYEAPGVYGARSVLRKDIGREVNIVLPFGGSRCALVLAGWDGACALDDVQRPKGEPNPTRVGDFTLQKNRRYVTEVTVRRGKPLAEVEVLLDDKGLLQWTGEPSKLILPRQYWKLRPHTLAIGTCAADAVFHKVTLRMLDGTTTPLLAPLPMQQTTELAELAPVASNAAAAETVTVTVDSSVAARCMRVRPTSGSGTSLTYRLGKQFDIFTGEAFCEKVASGSALVYRIVGDGKELWRAKMTDAVKRRKGFSILVDAVETLELMTEGTGKSARDAGLWVHPRLVTCYGIPLVGPQAPIWQDIERFVSGGNLPKSEYVGGKGGKPFEFVPREGAVLVGLELTGEQVGPTVSIKSLQPIFFSRRGRIEGPTFGEPGAHRKTLLARPGYAVAGIEVFSRGTRVNAVTLVFRRLLFTGLDAKQGYTIRWGSDEVKKRVRLHNEGRPVIGIHGRSGDVVGALGVVYGPR